MSDVKHKFLNRDRLISILIALLIFLAFAAFWTFFVARIGQMQWDAGRPTG